MKQVKKMDKPDLVFQKSYLSRRFIVFLFGILSVVSVCFLVLFYYFYNSQITGERTQASQSVSLLLKSSLEGAMLRRDLPGLNEIVGDLGKQDGIEEVMILSPQGEVRFASREERLGEQEDSIIQQFCPDCTPGQLNLQPETRFFTTPQGTEVLRTFHPVKNRPQCMECHGNAEEHPVNGILVVDYDAEPVRRKGLINILILMGAGAFAVVLSALSAWWFMQRYVLKPIGDLKIASQGLSQGNLGTRVRVEGKDEMAILGRTFNHMAERMQHSHQVLKSREQFLQDLIDAVPDGVRVIDPYYQIVVANRAYAEQSGFSDPQSLRQQFCYKITHQRDSPCPSSLRSCPLENLHEQNNLKFMETMTRPDGTLLSTEVYAARLLVGNGIEGETETLVVESIRDLEKAVHYSHEQKLASLGELAAGVAHEIHNPLASVRIALQVSTELLKTSQPKEIEELKDYLQLVEERVEQCLDVTGRLMRLGALASTHTELVEVNTVIRETLSLLRFEREQKGIAEFLRLSADNPRILAADNDLCMVILNLAQNAFHAMPEGGTLSVVSRLHAGMVEISVEDDGIGIPDEILRYIFDPFFSRRGGSRKGSGLGLTIARSLVMQHGGQIEVVEHTPGKTTFVLRFPDADYVSEDTEVA